MALHPRGRALPGDLLHLPGPGTLAGPATRCGFNRTYVAGIFKTEFGGFFHYVNALRLRYADEYRAAHPTASIGEIAEASGFGSRQSYYSVKEEMGS